MSDTSALADTKSSNYSMGGPLSSDQTSMPSVCDPNICEMCRNYELQLQIVQVNEDGLRSQLAQSQEMMKNLKDELRKEQAARVEVEEAFSLEARSTERKLQELLNQLEDSNGRLDRVSALFKNFESDINLQLAHVVEMKEESKRDVTRLKNENNALLGRHIAKSREMQSEIINLPQDLNEIHFYVLKLKEDFITTLVAKERNEETLKSERSFIEDQSRSEIQNRDGLIEELTQDNESLRSELKQLRSDHEKLGQKLEEQEEILDQCQEKIAKLVVENDNLLSELKWKVDDLTTSNGKLEDENIILRNKVSSLQLDLENSEAVQKDFVTLSQSLQIQLEKIRQSDSEVRWQHEEDVHDCNNCKKKLNSRRDKSHCNHCGRIFCLDCNCKVIYSGPKRRPNKVCSVCHTLLDHESAPFFSNQLPSGST